MKNLKTKLRESLIKITGYYILKEHALPVGCDLIIDLKSKINFPISTIFDIGANVGKSSYAFRQIFPHAELNAFEPNPGIFQTLVKNLRNSQIHLHNVGLGKQRMLYASTFQNIEMFYSQGLPLAIGHKQKNTCKS